MNCLCIVSDFGACFEYRVRGPFTELKKFGVNLTYYPFLPRDPRQNDLMTLLNFVYPYDLVIVQRCFRLGIMWHLRQVCDILGKKLIFETDDDYLHIPLHNPCAAEFLDPKRRWEFLEILRMADMITVSTQELKNVYYPYNKNIAVLPNNIPGVQFFKDSGEVQIDLESPYYDPIISNGFVHLPAYTNIDGAKFRVIRIGYTGTVTHREDFNTIKGSWFKTIKKLSKNNSIQVVYIGDDYFARMHDKELGGSNMLHIPATGYEMYYQNIRNLDIGIAPLEINIFNMSKSPNKAIEYASWGIPAVLPNYITYDREFKHNETALFYNNPAEFEEQLTRIVEDSDLRNRLGQNARMHVLQNRLESVHAQERFELYQGLLNTSRPIKIFKPNTGETLNAGTIDEVSTDCQPDACKTA